MKKIIPLLLCGLLLGQLSISYADTDNKLYQVELVIFSHFSSLAQQNPVADINGDNLPQKMIELTSSNASNYSYLPAQKFILKKESYALKNNPQYQILLHIAWRQTLADPSTAVPIHIYGGKVYTIQGKGITSTGPSKKYWQVNGTLKLSVIRYINAKLNLTFTLPTKQLPKSERNTTSNGQSKSIITQFALQQSRRMRSDELNYFGTPLYGALIKIVPVDTKK